MYKVTILAQKGGTGKTTICVNLAVAAEAAGWSTAVVDLDPQASAASWGDQREGESPTVVAVPPPRLEAALAAAAQHGAALALIDTAPHSEQTALAAARAANIALVPLRPGILDLRALGTTIEICTLAGVRTAVVLNQVPPRGRLAEEAAEAITGLGIELAPCRLVSRIAVVHALTAGAGVIEHAPPRQGRGRGAHTVRLAAH